MADPNDLKLRDADRWDFDGTRDRIVDLAGRGFSLTYISKATGVPYTTVNRLLKSEFQERNSNRQQTIEAHAQTVQWLKLKLTERIALAQDKWDRRDGELLLKVLEREARLYGTDQPTQHQHEVNVTVESLSDEDLLKQLAAEGYQLLPPAPQVRQLPEPVEDAHFEVRPEDTVEPVERQCDPPPEAGGDSSGER